jgi:FixJ family two-component response regulator
MLLDGHQLTSRQVEVLRLVAEGLTSKERGTRLNISPKTVEFSRWALAEETWRQRACRFHSLRDQNRGH